MTKSRDGQLESDPQFLGTHKPGITGSLGSRTDKAVIVNH